MRVIVVGLGKSRASGAGSPRKCPREPRERRRMFISHRTKSIFIHIQKTAGDAIAAAVRKDDPAPDTDRFGGRRHLFARDVKAAIPPEVWASHRRFAVVRNPWDRLVWWYSMCGQVPQSNPFAKVIRENAPTFTDFVGRFERLADDYAMGRGRLGLTHDLPRTNTSSHAGYRDYYTAETKAIDARRFPRDIAHFGYEF